MKFLLLIFSFLVCFNVQAQKVTMNVTVTKVFDGDTFQVRDSLGKVFTVRTVGNNTPEHVNIYVTKEQPWGQQVADSVRSIILRKNITLMIMGTDRYKRTLVRVYVDGIGDLSTYTVKNGWAWAMRGKIPYKEYQVLYGFQKLAKAAKIGLWSEEVEPIRPETWIKNHSGFKSNK